MNNKRLLLLFVRNPELGRVKTRLAATVGPAKALEIYIYLLQHTREITQQLPVQKRVYYADIVSLNDLWPNAQYQKRVQPSGDLGLRMETAFAEAFDEGYGEVVIIGSDCLELSADIVQSAYEALQQHDVVVGPALDGGYYLLGMKKLHPALFREKRWSTESVFQDTLKDLRELQLSYSLLPCLSDVDHAEDLGENFFLLS